MSYAQESRAVHLVALAWALFSISLIFLGLRLWVHLFGPRQERNRITASGFLILISLICELIHCVLITVAYHYGLGQHLSRLSSHEQMLSIKYIMIIQGIAVATPMFGRISFSIFLLRIIGRLRVWQKPTLWGVISVQAVFTIVTLIQIYAQCGSKVAALWDPVVAAKATCQNSMVQTIIGYVQSSLNSACDLLLTILPGSIVWRLQQTLTKKIVLGVFLCLSIFAFAASLVKDVEIGNLASRGDITWDFSTLSIWVCVENNVIIVVASIPTLRPLMKTSNHSTTSDYNDRSRGTGPNSSKYAQQSGTLSSCQHDIPLKVIGKQEDDGEEDMERIWKGGRNAIVRKKEIKVVYGDSTSLSDGSDSGERLTGLQAFPA